MRVTLAAALMTLPGLCLASGATWAQPPGQDATLQVGRVRKTDDGYKVIYSVQNHTLAAMRIVMSECAALNKAGQPLEVDSDVLSNVESKGIAYGTFSFDHTPDAEVTFACRVSDVSYD